VLYIVYCFIICLYVLSFMMGNPLRFPNKTMLYSSLPPIACMTDVVLFFYVCVCLRITVSKASLLYNIVIVIHDYLGSPPVFDVINVAHPFCALCFDCYCVCLIVAYPILPESLDCAFLIAASVLSNIYLGSAYRFFSVPKSWNCY